MKDPFHKQAPRHIPGPAGIVQGLDLLWIQDLRSADGVDLVVAGQLRERKKAKPQIYSIKASMGGLGNLSGLSADSLRMVLLDREIRKERLHCVASSSTQLLRQVLGLGGVKLRLDLRLVKLAAKWGAWLQHADGLQLELRHSGSAAGAEDAASFLALLLPGPNNGISALVIKGVSAPELFHGTIRQHVGSSGLLLCDAHARGSISDAHAWGNVFTGHTSASL
jgi:hypothetical protein